MPVSKDIVKIDEMSDAIMKGLTEYASVATDDDHMFQVRQTGLQRGDHLLKVKTPEALGRNHHLGLAMLQHE